MHKPHYEEQITSNAWKNVQISAKWSGTRIDAAILQIYIYKYNTKHSKGVGYNFFTFDTEICLEFWTDPLSVSLHNTYSTATEMDITSYLTIIFLFSAKFPYKSEIQTYSYYFYLKKLHVLFSFLTLRSDYVSISYSSVNLEFFDAVKRIDTTVRKIISIFYSCWYKALNIYDLLTKGSDNYLKAHIGQRKGTSHSWKLRQSIALSLWTGHPWAA